MPGTRLGAAAIALALLLVACGDDLRAPGGGGPPGGVDGGPDVVDAGVLGVFCDDGNACTVDSIEGDGCRFDAIEDGALCEDGDLCTLGDRCQAGQCVAGARAEGEMDILGSLDNLSGRRLALGPDRFVVVTSEDLFRGRVQVVARTASGLTTLATWAGDLTLIVLGAEDILAQTLPESDLVAVTAVADRTIRLFSVSDEAVVPRGEVEVSEQINSVAGHGDRLWMCAGNSLVGFRITLVDVANPDAPLEVGSMLLGSAPCGSTATNQDGSRVYLNTADGVRYIDTTPLDTGGDPTLSDVFAPTAGVSVSGAHLLLLTATGVRVLDEPSLAEVVTVPVPGARAAALVGTRLLVEGLRAAAGGSEFYVSWYDALGGGAPDLLDDVVTARFLGPPGPALTFKSATDGATLLTGIHGFDLTGDRLDELRIPALVPLAVLGRASATGLRAYHPSGAGAAAIDVASPAAPAHVTGGAFADARPVRAVAIDDSLAAPALISGLPISSPFDDATRVSLDPTNPYFPNPLPVERWTLSSAAELLASDSFSLRYQGASELFIAGDLLYQFRRPDLTAGTVASLQAYWLPALGGGAAGHAVFDLPLPAASSGRRGVDVDPRARIAVVSTEAASDGGPALLVYDLASSPPALLRSLPVDAVYWHLRVSGHRVAALAAEEIAFFDLDAAAEIARVPTPDAFERQLLAFDGNTLYFGQLTVVPGTATYSLAAVPFGATELPPLLEVRGVPRGLVPLDSALAVAFDTQLLTIHPRCP